jgi:hypothetical protein
VLLLGIRPFFVVGVILLVIAVPLQTGAVTATKAVKFSAKLVTGQPVSVEDPATPTTGPADRTGATNPGTGAPTPSRATET